jgi:hypothetical protein
MSDGIAFKANPSAQVRANLFIIFSFFSLVRMRNKGNSKLIRRNRMRRFTKDSMHLSDRSVSQCTNAADVPERSHTVP